MAASSELPLEAEGLGVAAVAPGWRSMIGRLVADRTALAGLIILTVVFTVAVAAPLIAPYDPNAQNVLHQFKGPSVHHLLGTDEFGRDEFSRIVFGARISVLTSLAIGVSILAIGVIVGTVSGLAGGLVDGLILRVVDVMLAFPN